jgi:nucleoside-diphosphate-sugar epimerase
MRVLIFGCGYVGSSLGKELISRGYEVWGVRRSEGLRPVEPCGIRNITADITVPETFTNIPGQFDLVINCIAARTSTPEAYRSVYLEGTRNLVQWLTPNPPQLYLYTSSTGVFGQNDGSLVTEDSPMHPDSEAGQILVQTEATLQTAWSVARFPVVILRLAGIYGPGRGYWLRQFLEGEARIEGDGSRILNMIHLEDVVGSALAAIQSPRPGETYNVVDDYPSTQLEVMRWLSQRLLKPLPPSTPVAGDSARRRATNKRVSNRKLREAMGYRLKYPSFREGYERELRRLSEGS